MSPDQGWEIISMAVVGVVASALVVVFGAKFCGYTSAIHAAGDIEATRLSSSLDI
jgi:hypothetical protein